MARRRHPCPECGVEALATPEARGAIHLDCPVCQSGSVFQDGRGGYECTECSQRFLIHLPHPNDHYGGPEHVGGPLRWWDRPMTGWQLAGFCGGWLAFLWLVPSPYWSLLFLGLIVWEHCSKRNR